MEGVDNTTDRGSSSSCEERVPICMKLSWPQEISKFYEDLEDVECDIEQLQSDIKVIGYVINNYIIVKEILSNLEWRDKLACKHVSNTWRSAVLALKKEQLNPVDFVVDLHLLRMKNVITYKNSDNFNVEPLVVFTFMNTRLNLSKKCMILSPTPCDPPCEEKHSVFDYIQHMVVSPRDCMLTVKAIYLTYQPVPQSITYKHAIKRHMYEKFYPFVGGLYIPAIPEVQFHIIKIKSQTDMQKEYYDVVSNLAKDNVFKGVLVYVTEKLLLDSTADKYSYLNHFKEVQPDIPYALAGCLVDEVVCEESDINTIIENINDNVGNCFVTENLTSIGIFTIPKRIYTAGQIDKNIHFEMYSVVIQQYDWTKQEIQAVISEFSKNVPRFEHSVALKLSCVGRNKKHKIEEEFFRSQFPTTTMIGCYGNGELGLNHPELILATPPPQKKIRITPPSPRFLHLYATSILYIGWGKITSPPQGHV